MNMQISTDVAKLLEAAQQLSASDRMQLAGLLAGDVEGPPLRTDAEPLTEVVRRRLEEIRSGKVELRDWDELMDEMDRRNEASDE